MEASKFAVLRSGCGSGVGVELGCKCFGNGFHIFPHEAEKLWHGQVSQRKEPKMELMAEAAAVALTHRSVALKTKVSIPFGTSGMAETEHTLVVKPLDKRYIKFLFIHRKTLVCGQCGEPCAEGEACGDQNCSEKPKIKACYHGVAYDNKFFYTICAIHYVAVPFIFDAIKTPAFVSKKNYLSGLMSEENFKQQMMHIVARTGLDGYVPLPPLRPAGQVGAVGGLGEAHNSRGAVADVGAGGAGRPKGQGGLGGTGLEAETLEAHNAQVSAEDLESSGGGGPNSQDILGTDAPKDAMFKSPKALHSPGADKASILSQGGAMKPKRPNSLDVLAASADLITSPPFYPAGFDFTDIVENMKRKPLDILLEATQVVEEMPNLGEPAKPKKLKTEPIATFDHIDDA